MAQFHIGENGKPNKCDAQIGHCPLGQQNQHYNSKEEAQYYIEQENMKKYNINQSARKNDNTLIINQSLYDISHKDYKKTISFIRSNYSPQEIRESLDLTPETHQELKNTFGKLISERYFNIDCVRSNHELLSHMPYQNNEMLKKIPHAHTAFHDYLQDVKDNNHTMNNMNKGKQVTRLLLDLSMDEYVKSDDSDDKVSIFRTGTTIPVEEYSGDIATYARNADALRPDNRPGREGSLYGSPDLLGVARWTRANASLKTIVDKETREYKVNPHNVFVYPVRKWEDYSWRGKDRLNNVLL